MNRNCLSKLNFVANQMIRLLQRSLFFNFTILYKSKSFLDVFYCILRFKILQETILVCRCPGNKI